MRVAIVGEGTFPHYHGGVSVWCDQMIRGMPDVQFHLTSLTAHHDDPITWELSDNIEGVASVPLWGPSSTRRRLYGLRRRKAQAVCRRLITSLTEPDEYVDIEALAVALYRWFGLSQEWDMEDVLLSEPSVGYLLIRWHSQARESRRPWPRAATVADAVSALRFLSHFLRPLSTPPPRADIVHLVANGLSGLVGLSARWRYNTPYILSEHGVYLRERYLSMREMDNWPLKVLALRFINLLSRLTYRQASLVAPGNVYNRRWEVLQGAREDDIRTIYNGVDPSVFQAAKGEVDGPTVAWVGRVDPIKDLETLIRGFALVAEEMPEARLRMFGGTPKGNEAYLDRMRALISELGLEGRAVFEGRVEFIQDAYTAGSVVALTSISEGFPYTVIEAMSCARATVSTDVGGVSEAVGDAGLIVPPRDPAALAKSLLTLLRDPVMCNNLAEAARSRVMHMFTLEQSLATFRNLYDDFASMQADVEDTQPPGADPNGVLVA